MAIRREVIADGRDSKSKWIWPDEAVSILPTDRSMLSRYIRQGCAALDGRKLKVRRIKVPKGWGKGVHFPRYQYLRADIEQIAAARTNPDQTYEDDDGKWLATPLALKTYRFNKDRLGGLGKDGSVRRQWRHAMTSDGVKFRGMFFYLESDLKRLLNPAAAEPPQKTAAEPPQKTAADWAAKLAPGWPMAKEAAAKLGVHHEHIGFWARKGCRYLPGGKKLRSRLIQVPGRRRKLRVYHADDLGAIQAARDGGTSADSSRLTFDEAKLAFGFTRGRLSLWRKGCPFLKGARLKAELEDRTLGGEANEVRKVLTFSRADLEEIQRRRGQQADAWLTASAAASIYDTTETELAELAAKGLVRRKLRFTWDREAKRNRGSFFYCPDDLAEICRQAPAGQSDNGDKPATNAHQVSDTPPADLPDGPVQPSSFRWDGRVHDLGLEPRAFDLLVYVWGQHVKAGGPDTGVRGRSTRIEVCGVGHSVFGHKSTPYDTMKYHVSRLNTALAKEPLAAPVTLTKEKRRDFLTLSVG